MPGSGLPKMTSGDCFVPLNFLALPPYTMASPELGMLLTRAFARVGSGVGRPVARAFGLGSSFTGVGGLVGGTMLIWAGWVVAPVPVTFLVWGVIGDLGRSFLGVVGDLLGFSMLEFPESLAGCCLMKSQTFEITLPRCCGCGGNILGGMILLTSRDICATWLVLGGTILGGMVLLSTCDICPSWLVLGTLILGRESCSTLVVANLTRFFRFGRGSSSLISSEDSSSPSGIYLLSPGSASLRFDTLELLVAVVVVAR